jgi:hypothetical protein
MPPKPPKPPKPPAQTLFRHEGLERYTSLFAALMLGGLAAGSLAAGVGIWAGGQPGESLILIVLAVVVAGLAVYVWNDSVAKVGWRAEITGNRVVLRLPGTRSYLSRPPAFAGEVLLSALAGVEWREERYAMGPVGVVVQAWSLRLKDGQRIVLGEDRPIPRTGTYTTLMRRSGEAIARAAGLRPMRLQRADGDAGFLGLAFTRGPDWP